MRNTPNRNPIECPDDLPAVGSLLLIHFVWRSIEYDIPALLLDECTTQAKVLIGETEHTLVRFDISANRKGWTLSNIKGIVPGCAINWADVRLFRLDGAGV